MRKLHIINLEKMGGVERLFLQYIQDVTTKQDFVFCISNQIGPEIAQHLTGRKVTFVNRILNNYPIKFPPFLRKYALQTKTWLANPEAIIVWDLVPVFVAKPTRGKVIYYDHGCSWRYPHNKKTMNFFAALDGTISASYASKRVIALRFNLSCPSQVLINRILPPANIFTGDKPLTAPLRLGIAARLVGLKGISVALLTLKNLLDRGINVTLDIAGKGPDEHQFIQLAQKLGIAGNVNFLGFRDDLSDFFNSIHIYLSTPVTEPFGLSCLESLFYGVPVIYPLIDGQPEVVKNGVCGIGITPDITPEAHFEQCGINVNFPYDVYFPGQDALHPPRLLAPEKCADAVLRIVNGDYEAFRKNAFEHVKSNFDASAFMSDFNSTISEILDASRA